MKIFPKSVKIWLNYGQESVAPFFGPHCRVTTLQTLWNSSTLPWLFTTLLLMFCYPLQAYISEHATSAKYASLKNVKNIKQLNKQKIQLKGWHKVQGVLLKKMRPKTWSKQWSFPDKIFPDISLFQTAGQFPQYFLAAAKFLNNFWFSSALTLLVGFRKSIQHITEQSAGGVVICLQQGADWHCLHMVWPMPLPSQNLSISCLRIILPFSYWLTLVVLKMPLFWCFPGFSDKCSPRASNWNNCVESPMSPTLHS